MKKNLTLLIYPIFIIGLFLLSISSCTKANSNIKGLTVKDIDGNIYDVVKIGTQVWMKENLRTTRYRDGTPIPMVTDSAAWYRLTSGAYCWYNNDSTNGPVYGALYNFYTIESSHKLCPSGWHIPSMDEWLTLINYLGGDTIAGGKMKEANSLYWHSPNTGADNSSGFTGLPGGYRGDIFSEMGYGGYWWSTTAGNGLCLHYNFKFASPFSNIGNGNTGGNSVRCIKDN